METLVSKLTLVNFKSIMIDMEKDKFVMISLFFKIPLFSNMIQIWAKCFLMLRMKNNKNHSETFKILIS